MPHDKEWLTYEEAAQYLGVSYDRLVQAVSRGVFPVASVPGFKGSRRLSRSRLDEMMQQTEETLGGERHGRRGRRPARDAAQ